VGGLRPKRAEEQQDEQEIDRHDRGKEGWVVGSLGGNTEEMRTWNIVMHTNYRNNAKNNSKKLYTHKVKGGPKRASTETGMGRWTGQAFKVIQWEEMPV
jgi:hypothetical protein